MAKIVVHGFYGEGNLGDEAILDALIREMRRFPRARLVVFSKYPDRVAGEHAVRSVSEQDKGRRLRRMWEMLTSRLVVVGGGGLLRDLGDDPANVRRWLGIIRAAQGLRRKTALWDVGADDIRFPESAALIRETLARADFISVRDGDSKDVLRSLGVEGEVMVAADPALLLVEPGAARTAGDASPLRVMVSVRHWFRRGLYIERADLNDSFLRALGQALDFLVEEYGATVDFMPLRTTGYDDDRSVARAVIAGMKNQHRVSLIESVPGVDCLIGVLPRYALTIGMRLHSLILSAGSGVPVIGLEYMPKVRGFMKSIAQEEYSLPLETISRDALVDRITATFGSYDERRRLIRARISALREKARESVEMLAALAGLRTASPDPSSRGRAREGAAG
ncbi:MAG: polysaccharide pyruvyl transferase family protein [Chlamydiota bacterium]